MEAPLRGLDALADAARHRHAVECRDGIGIGVEVVVVNQIGQEGSLLGHGDGVGACSPLAVTVRPMLAVALQPASA
jgi:hypothetical protein